jgi:hypothetical protein
MQNGAPKDVFPHFIRQEVSPDGYHLAAAMLVKRSVPAPFNVIL